MSDFQDIIDLLLQKRENLEQDKGKRIAEALLLIDEEFRGREQQINALLEQCGYIECTPVEQTETFESEQIETNTPIEEQVYPESCEENWVNN